jgi:hypothetical protein
MTAGSSPAPPKRSMDEIEADILRTREEMAETLGVLADKVNPRLQAARAAERAKIKATALTGRAKAAVHSLTDAGLPGRVRRPTTIALVVAAAGLAAGAVVLIAKHRH